MDTKAAFTIVHNERQFLPLWIKHYKQYFNKEDIYVLDDGTTDRSTENLDVNVLKLKGKYSFDHNFLCKTVNDYQRTLLAKYKTVLFSEVDEFVLTHPDGQNLAEFIDSMQKPMYRCLGWNIVQKTDSEKPLKLDQRITDQRNFGYKDVHINKVCISQKPCNWTCGFHNGQGEEVFENLLLIHLHSVDLDIAFARHNERLERNISPMEPSGLGSHNKSKWSKEKIDQFFFKRKLLPLPEFFKKIQLLGK